VVLDEMLVVLDEMLTAWLDSDNGRSKIEEQEKS
jgi:hypothetical protein